MIIMEGYILGLCLIVFFEAFASPIDLVDSKQGRIISFDSFEDILEQTKDLSQLISNTASSVGTTVSDYAAEFFNQGMQQTTGFFNSGHDLVVNNFHEAKKFGEKSMLVLENAASATGTFISENLFKLPFSGTTATDKHDAFDFARDCDDKTLFIRNHQQQ